MRAPVPAVTTTRLPAPSARTIQLQISSRSIRPHRDLPPARRIIVAVSSHRPFVSIRCLFHSPISPAPAPTDEFCSFRKGSNQSLGAFTNKKKHLLSVGYKTLP